MSEVRQGNKSQTEGAPRALSASIIIPTYNRPAQLLLVLEALARQEFPPARTEVLVVDDGSTESYASVTERDWPFCLRYVRQENQGEVTARNLAVSLAQSSFLIFLDDDIYAAPTYVSALIAEHERYPRAILMGVLNTYFASTGTGGSAPTIFQEALAEQPQNITPGEISYVDIGSGTMSVAKEVYQAVGGMRALGQGGRNAWGGMDFAYRAYQAGYKARTVAQAIAYHDDYAINSLETMSKRYWKVSRMAVLHFQRFPELLPQVPMFRDKTPVDWRHDSPLLIVRKCARQVWNSKTGIQWMESTARFLEKHYPSRKLLVRLYRWIVYGNIYQGYRAGLREFGAVKS